jgi:hypothetical protein
VGGGGYKERIKGNECGGNIMYLLYENGKKRFLRMGGGRNKGE